MKRLSLTWVLIRDTFLSSRFSLEVSLRIKHVSPSSEVRPILFQLKAEVDAPKSNSSVKQKLRWSIFPYFVYQILTSSFPLSHFSPSSPLSFHPSFCISLAPFLLLSVLANKTARNNMLSVISAWSCPTLSWGIKYLCRTTRESACLRHAKELAA